MGSETVERLRTCFRAWNENDQETWLDAYTEDVEIRPAISNGVPVVGMDFRGHAGARAWWDEVKSMNVEFLLHPEEFRDLGEAVLAIGCTESRSSTGVEMRYPHAWLFWIRDGRAYRLDTYIDPREAIAAAPTTSG